MIGRLNLVAAIVLMGACQSVPPETEPQPGPTADVAEAPRGLPPQRLGKDECGLFLWSKADISRFVFFSRASEDTALAYLNNASVELIRTGRAGDIFGQFFTETTYLADSGLEVRLSFEPGEELVDGARISSGIINFSDVDGWRNVLPVLGARVCQPYAGNAEVSDLDILSRPGNR
jgi:hypothetical protein